MAEFTVYLARPVTSTATSPPVAQWRFDGDEVGVRFSTELPGGFARCEVGGTAELPEGLVPVYLPQIDAEIGPFDHLTVNVGMNVVWEGRVVEPVLTGSGEPIGLVADGYWSLLNDGYYDAPASGGLVTNGAILQDVTTRLAPPLRIGTAEQYVDPAVPTDPDEWDGMRGGAIFDHVAKVGDPFGRRVDPMIWHNRTLWLRPRAVPARPDYVLDLGEHLEISVDWNQLYGAVRVRYQRPTDTNDSPERFTSWAVDASFVERYGFQRELTIEGGTLTDSVATTVRNTALEHHRQPQYAISASFAENRGLDRPGGGEVPPWLVQAGQWVEVADLGTFILTQTEYDSSGRSLNIQLNREHTNWEQQLQTMQQIVAAINDALNPQTGGRA